MITAGILLALTCIGIVTAVFYKPSISLFKISLPTTAIVAVIGACLMMAFGVVSPITVWRNLTIDTAVNPIKILVLFISMTLLSVFLDELNFFSFFADFILKRAKTSLIKLFISLYLVVSILTVFTSNDIIVLTFTPIICFFSKRAKINPLPFLFCEFVAANTWSMALIVGNPTNIYLATGAGLGFFEYFKIMFLPTLACGVISFIILFLVFYKQLRTPISSLENEMEGAKITDKPLFVLGIIFLGACIILLAVSSYLNLETYLICLTFAMVEIIVATVYKLIKRENLKTVTSAIKRAPYELIPFVLSMFVVVLGVEKSGLIKVLSQFLSKGNSIFTYGISSFLASNLINNIPMSVLFSSLAKANLGAVYASIIGSNIGALFTPVGALAGIMWCNMLKIYSVKVSFLDFTKKGCLIAVPSILISLLVLFFII